jgi:hypothetical protein
MFEKWECLKNENTLEQRMLKKWEYLKNKNALK